MQLAYQLADSVSGFAYSFVGSCIILFFMNLVPGLKLRASEEAEVLGMDDAEIGEFAYDYVELTRDVLNGDALVAEDVDVDGESKYSSADDDGVSGGGGRLGMGSPIDGGGVEKAFGAAGVAAGHGGMGVPGSGGGSVGFGSSTLGDDERALNQQHLGSSRRR